MEQFREDLGEPRYGAVFTKNPEDLKIQRHVRRRAFLIKYFYSALCFEHFLFQPFPPIFHVIGSSRSAIHLSLLTPPILRYGDFMKSLVTARKSFIRSRKLSRRSTMTRLRQECSYSDYQKAK